MKRRIRGPLMGLVLSIVTLVVCLLVVESILTIVSWAIYPRLTVSDAELGWRYEPTAGRITRRFSRDVAYDLAINSEGFRDDEFAVRPGEVRVMVLGDSVTFGLEAAQDDVFCAQAERSLRGRRDLPSVDIMNFGVPNYSTAQELLVLKKYFSRYRPDVVILMVLGLNDFTDNTAVMSGGWFVPHFLLRGGALVLENHPTRSERVMSWLRNHSALWYLLVSRIPYTRKAAERQIEMSETARLELMQALLGETAAYCASKRTPLIVAYVAEPAEPAPRLAAVEHACSERGVRFLTIPLLPEERIGGTGHWNRAGHARASAALEQVLLGGGYLQSRTH